MYIYILNVNTYIHIYMHIYVLETI